MIIKDSCRFIAAAGSTPGRVISQHMLFLRARKALLRTKGSSKGERTSNGSYDRPSQQYKTVS